VVAASERAARAIATDYHRARRSEGLTAWTAPNVLNWEEFVRRAWETHAAESRLVLDRQQEQALWAEIIAADRGSGALLEGPLYRVANLAMEAHRLLCLYAPQFLQRAARNSWQQDAGAFSGWLTAFDDTCRAGGLMSPARLPLELKPALKTDEGKRASLLLAGFDRILPSQRGVLDAWGPWHEMLRGPRAERTLFYRAADENAELAACALWCKEQLTTAPHARLLVITQDVARRRGEIERAFLEFVGSSTGDGSRIFEFSLGVPLCRVPLARAALLLLCWLQEPLAEHELDWLFSTGQIAGSGDESRALTAFMRALRRRGWQRTQWKFDDFTRQRPGETLPEAWIVRIAQTKRRLEEFVRASSTLGRAAGGASPIAWAELVPELLQLAGWPGGHALTSAEFQAMRRWEQVLDACASLGFDGRRVEWKTFLRAVYRNLHETLFAPESLDAPILIAGPAESAGLSADAVWFLGVTEDAWPGRGSVHPLLPLDVQRSVGMPHASAQLDWDLASAVTDRLLASAPAVRFSYARQLDAVETRPSRLIMQATGAPQDVPRELAVPRIADALTVAYEDRSRIPFPGGEVRGGSQVLTAQSQCGFQAFARSRLGAESWQSAEAGLTAAQRGQLLHGVLHSVWSGPPDGIRSQAELVAIGDLRAFVERHVNAALQTKIPAGTREQMPERYLELEALRLTGLIAEWLRFEATRMPFVVEHTEMERDKTIEDLTLRLRLDRLDRLSDGKVLVVDYKTGDVSQKSWELPRPEDVQLPLYAGFALDRETEPVGGLVFAKIRAAERCFAGKAEDARGQLLPGLNGQQALVKTRLTHEELIAWRKYIERMARDFVEGHAEVNPREYPKTCDRCGLYTLCRFLEGQTESIDDTVTDAETDDA